jgi:excisionase family DNA binding protein
MKTTEPKDRLLRKEDVVNRLSLSLRTVDRLVSSGKLEKVKVMRAARFRESDVQALVEKGCK